jgi:hybrid cluster-associated redox disulfide protein
MTGPSADMSVGETMSTWPATIAVFLEQRIDCVGCRIRRFHTISEVSKLYNLELDLFLAKLSKAIFESM